MKKLMPALIAIALIIVIGAAMLLGKVLDRYSYSKEQADLTEYFDIRGTDDVPIILQDEQVEEHARLWDGVCYFDFATVHKYFNDRFYEDPKEGLLLYTLPDCIVRTAIGTGEVTKGDVQENRDYVIARYEEGQLYVAADFVKEYTNFAYELFAEPNHMQVDTVWQERQVATVSKNTQIRYQGGIKSDVLREVEKGEQVTILEEMETWSKVKTQDSYIGYIENKRLTDKHGEEPIPVTDYAEPVYTSQTRDHKINLAWHAVSSEAGNDTLTSMLENTKSINVISPTWFALTDNEGNFSSYASHEYVDMVHAKGMEVWGLVDNFTNGEVDTYEVLAGTSVRTKLIDNLIAVALEYDLDGINVDFESISQEAGEPFIEFIRELSIPCREHGLVLSVDNYVPMNHTDHYDRAEQGRVADYVIIMGYDEHYKGSQEAGSVASINFVEQGIANTVELVPAEKVINAVPFYTRIWQTTGTEVDSQAVGMQAAEQFIEERGITTVWDEETCQNYGEYQSGDGYYQVWLEDEQSIQVKLNIMSKYNVAGVAEWKLGFDKPGIWDVIEAYVLQ